MMATSKYHVFHFIRCKCTELFCYSSWNYILVRSRGTCAIQLSRRQPRSNIHIQRGERRLCLNLSKQFWCESIVNKLWIFLIPAYIVYLCWCRVELRENAQNPRWHSLDSLHSTIKVINPDNFISSALQKQQAIIEKYLNRYFVCLIHETVYNPAFQYLFYKVVQQPYPQDSAGGITKGNPVSE